MSTMKKRIPMFLLALAMMVAMALPTFAADYNNSLATYNSIRYGSCSLNINGNNVVYDNQNVNLYTTNYSNDQIWFGNSQYADNSAHSCSILVVNTSLVLGGVQYVLNANMTGSEWNANIKPYDSSNREIYMCATDINNPRTKIHLREHPDYYLRAVSSGSGSNVVFSKNSGTNWMITHLG